MPCSSGPKSQRGVGAAEPEGVVERDSDLRRPRLVWHVVEIAFGVGMLLVDGRWNHSALDRQNREYRLDRAGRAERVSRHRLGRAYRYLGRPLAEHALDSLGLRHVALLGRGAMGVDVINFVEIETVVFETHAHAFGDDAAFGGGRSDVMRVRIGRIAADFRDNSGSARNRGLSLLDDHGGRSFGHHKPVAVLVEWETRSFRFFIASGEGAHRNESADAQRRDCRLGSAHDRRIQKPSRIIRYASQMAWLPDAHALVVVKLAPRAP